MKRIIIFLSLLMINIPHAHAFFGIKKLLGLEFTALKQEIKGDANALKAEISGEVNGIKADLNAVLNMQNELNANLNANVAAIAGINNKVKNMSAGRDINSINDTGLMKYIIGVLYAILLVIIGLMKLNSKKMTKMYRERIQEIKLEKKFYKDSYISEKIKDEKELIELRSRHNNFIKENGGKE